MTYVSAFRPSTALPQNPNDRLTLFTVSGIVKIHSVVAIVTEDITSSGSPQGVPTWTMSLIAGSFAIDSSHSMLAGTRLTDTGTLTTGFSAASSNVYYGTDGTLFEAVVYNQANSLDTGAVEVTVFYEQVTIGASIVPA